MKRLALLALLCVLVGPSIAMRAGKVLLLPLPEDNSHIFVLRRIYDELSHRGHTAYVSIGISTCICAVLVVLTPVSKTFNLQSDILFNYEVCNTCLLTVLSVSFHLGIAQMLVPPGDVPKLTAIDKGENVSHITFETGFMDLQRIAPSLSPSQGPKAIDLVMQLWHAQCDTLLSDAALIKRLQVRMFLCLSFLQLSLKV